MSVGDGVIGVGQCLHAGIEEQVGMLAFEQVAEALVGAPAQRGGTPASDPPIAPGSGSRRRLGTRYSRSLRHHGNRRRRPLHGTHVWPSWQRLSRRTSRCARVGAAPYRHTSYGQSVNYL